MWVKIDWGLLLISFFWWQVVVTIFWYDVIFIFAILLLTFMVFDMIVWLLLAFKMKILRSEILYYWFVRKLTMWLILFGATLSLWVLATKFQSIIYLLWWLLIALYWLALITEILSVLWNVLKLWEWHNEYERKFLERISKILWYWYNEGFKKFEEVSKNLLQDKLKTYGNDNNNSNSNINLNNNRDNQKDLNG